ncbi:MAG: class I SAM-dependent methyltransferase [Clostridia bacterium]|nr:class I SAM-dependent methyltransferase [Clostridia bacterium]
MEQKSMTALVSAFSRAYHARTREVKIYDDTLAAQLLTKEEYAQIGKRMAGGAQFFFPGFDGGEDAALRRIVDEQLSPSPLGRAAFANNALRTAVRTGTGQYVILGAGYDTFAYRQPEWAKGLAIFELDHPATAADKQARLAHAGLAVPENIHFLQADLTTEGWQAALSGHPAFDQTKLTLCSLLGLTYYLSRESFSALLAALSGLLCKGSALVFDYPDENNGTEKAGERAKKQALLASGAKEAMLAGYSYKAMERLLAAHGFLIYEHLTPEEISAQYFAAHNQADPAHAMTAFDNVNYCLAVRDA